MRLIKLLSFAVIGILLMACQKEDISSHSTNDIEKVVKSMEELNIPPGFDWKLSESKTFNITREKKGLVWITSPDETVVFHRAMHAGQNNTYTVSLSIPTVYDQIKVNGKLLNTSQEVIDISLQEAKSAEATNYSLYFDGSDDYLNIGDITELNITQSFTVSFWMKQDNNTAYDRMFHKLGANSLTQDISVATYNNDFYVEVGNGSNSYGYWPSYASTISSGTWFHVAAVYDGTQTGNSNRLKLYINGSPVTMSYSGTIPSSTYNLAGYDTYVSYNSGSEYYGGYIDELRVWNTPRTLTEINNDIYASLSGTEPGLVAYYNFDTGTGTTTYDQTSGSYDGAITGASWSTSTGYALDSDGDGISDAYEDYPGDPLRAFDNFFPAAGFGSLAFEDLWPGKGDYDFNDIVVDYRFKTVTNASNEVVEIFGTFPVKASGAVLQNGFGFNLPDATSSVYTNMSSLSVQDYNVQESYINLAANGFESGQTRPTVIVFDNFYNVLPKTTPGIGVNTLESNPHVPYDTVEIKIAVSGLTLSDSDFSLSTWNPFIIKGMDRDIEIHLPDYTPTDLADQNNYGTYFDDSDPLSGKYYKSSAGLPWGIDLPVSFDWPEEKADITTVYHHFADWAESGGTVNTDWYNNIALYRNQSLIYTP